MEKMHSCEVCGNGELIPVLDLGGHPMCDDLVEVGSDRVCCEYPIEILLCDRCKTAHQAFQVPKVDLFPSSYHYRSRFTADVLNGMKDLVEKCGEFSGPMDGKLVLDVGCNDGSLLGFFRDRGCRTVGVEPTGAAEDAKEAGHTVYREFFTPELAGKIAEQEKPDFIVFTNVFAHIEDLESLLAAVKLLLKEATVVVVENHYLDTVLNSNQFDTFYHEHPRTYSVTSFKFMAETLGLSISRLEFPSRYGGNIRVFMGGNSIDDPAMDASIKAVLVREAKTLEKFRGMEQRMDTWIKNKKAQLDELVAQRGAIRAKAFPGRAAILVKLLGLNKDHIALVYEKPGSMKVGHYLPGTRIPIVADDETLKGGEEDVILNFAWHISKEISAYLSSAGFRGKVIDIVEDSDF